MLEADAPRNPTLFRRVFYSPVELRVGWRLLVFLMMVITLISASNALVHLGNHGDALRAAQEACRLAPSYWQTHVCLAQAALAVGGVAVAFGIVAFTPELDLAQMLPIAVVITVVARLAAFAALRAAARKQQ